MGNVITSEDYIEREQRDLDAESKAKESAYKSDFARSTRATMAANRGAARDRTRTQQKLVQEKQKEMIDSKKLKCPQCKTVEKKYICNPKVSTPIDQWGNIIENKIKFSNYCINCGYGYKKDPQTRKMARWDVTRSQ